MNHDTAKEIYSENDWFSELMEQRDMDHFAQEEIEKQGLSNFIPKIELDLNNYEPKLCEIKIKEKGTKTGIRCRDSNGVPRRKLASLKDSVDGIFFLRI